VRLTFSRELVTEPVIYELGQRFQIITNIRRADVAHDEGWVLLELLGDSDEIERGVSYLSERGVRVDQAEGDLVE
jgi:ABC-type methionine transport system ATPase subunit